MVTESNTSSVEAKAEVVEEKKKLGSLVDALFDAGTAWAEHGIGYGKLALEQSAKALERSAKALETLQEKLKKSQDGETKTA